VTRHLQRQRSRSQIRSRHRQMAHTPQARAHMQADCYKNTLDEAYCYVNTAGQARRLAHIEHVNDVRWAACKLRAAASKHDLEAGVGRGRVFANGMWGEGLRRGRCFRGCVLMGLRTSATPPLVPLVKAMAAGV